MVFCIRKVFARRDCIVVGAFGSIGLVISHS